MLHCIFKRATSETIRTVQRCSCQTLNLHKAQWRLLLRPTSRLLTLTVDSSTPEKEGITSLRERTCLCACVPVCLCVKLYSVPQGDSCNQSVCKCLCCFPTLQCLHCPYLLYSEGIKSCVTGVLKMHSELVFPTL